MKKEDIKKIIQECIKEIEHPEDEFDPEKDAPEPTDWSKAKIVKRGMPEYDKLMAALKSGQAKRQHLYDVRNALRPRGSMKKESLSLDIYNNLVGTFKSWTDPQYGDSLTAEKAISLLKQNLDQEVAVAWKRFIDGPPTGRDGD